MRPTLPFLALTTAAVFISTSAISAPVTLRGSDGAIDLTGELLEWDDQTYLLDHAMGQIRIARTLADCFGAACPNAAGAKPGSQPIPEPDLVLTGSDTVGGRLMPMLIGGYAFSQSGSVTRQDLPAQNPRTQAASTLTVTDGTGTRQMVAQVRTTGSGPGIAALIADETDIAMSSRPATPEEIAALTDQGRGDITSLDQDYIVGLDSVLVIVSPDNPTGALTMEQLSDIYAGRIRNWADLGGPDLPITVLTRPEVSGTRAVFAQAVLAPGAQTMTPDAQVMHSNEAVTAAVLADPGAIGYVGFAYRGDARQVDLIGDCGLPMHATAFAAKAEQYPLQRRLRLFVDNGPLSDQARALLDFAVSPMADPHIREAGFIDLSITADPAPLDAEQVLASAKLTGTRRAEDLARRMLRDLARAERLSTTFRFVSGSSRLDNRSLRDLDRMVAYLARPENAGRQVIVAGFADGVGKFRSNARLAASRAATVRAALLARPGAETLSRNRLHSASYSELAPVGCNTTEQGRSANRRVEIWIK